ncbi:Reticulon-1-A,Reticulon-3-B,Reticulon-1-B,Reticulon-2,Reticulon-4,Reticulon-1,Reticulon-3-A,Reticulon-3 [Mytilus edulis]|uniref:Reticulon-like protein n=1 Tax=Mytilus edulis TaxID=6550 RepID=A0A8S3UVX9_MYTED|nr:Reticulon-1-A,Reticulon-3-B,Reticulon-1-B,Reticulon-2,Reticulon-4,Reticulon-1,Reticulon-3-A,Reticulon-3 [Mytilus edulis]
MADNDLLGDFQSDNNYHQEDFEKVEKIPEQDEEISSSYVGEEAEADRYDPGPVNTDPVDNFNDLVNLGSAGQSAFATNDPFSYQPQEPTAPPKEVDQLMSAFENENTESETKIEPQQEVPKLPKTESVKQSTSPPADDEEDTYFASDHKVTTIEEEPEHKVLLELIYWRDLKKTGIVFGSMLFILLSLAIFSVLSVLAYLSLAVLSVTLSFRIYKNVLAAVQKSGDAHPFKALLDLNIDLPEDKAQMALKNICKHINCTVRELRRLFLIEDLVDSMKFALLLWVLTYIGSWFNGMTLIIMG